MCWKFCAIDLCWKVPCFPNFVLTLCQEFITFRSFSFIVLPASFFPWNCQLFFIHVGQSTMSGLRLVGTMYGNVSFCSKSTANCQSWLLSKFPVVLLSCLWVDFWSALTIRFMDCFLFLGIRILPLFWARAMNHDVRIWCWFSLLPYRGQSGVSDRFNLFRFYGNCSTS